MKGKRKFSIALLLLPLLLLASCFKDDNFEKSTGSTESITPVSRVKTEETRHVLVMVSAGYNSLSGYLTEDLEDLSAGMLPQGKNRQADVLVVLSRLPKNGFSTTECPVLYQMYAGSDGKVVRDTLKKWNEGTKLVQEETLREALTLVREKFPAKGYGMVFSSHASGWIPKGYKRSIGQDKEGSVSYEMDIDEFARAIPYHLDYVLLDVCLSACVEVAWELREKADILGFSATEILAEGFVYTTLTQRLLQPVPDPLAVCRDYFEQYDPQTGSATITVVDTREMDPLAQVCKELFERYRVALKIMDPNAVQRYFRPSATPDFVYLYDLFDMLEKAGITEAEKASLQEAMNRCILYFAKTPAFLGISLKNAHGLSMYLPSSGNETLDAFYRTRLQWNQATGLIK